MPSDQLQSLRKINIGGVSKPELLGRLTACGVQMNPLAEQLFLDSSFDTSAVQTAMTVVLCPIAALGLEQGGTFGEVMGRAYLQGWSHCPLELGPHLRLQFVDQVEGFLGQPHSQNCAPPGSVTVASLPISEDDDVPKGFYLRVIQGVPWLRGYRSWPGHVWAPSDRFAFTVNTRAA
jgi:hypothetical protein